MFWALAHSLVCISFFFIIIIIQDCYRFYLIIFFSFQTFSYTLQFINIKSDYLTAGSMTEDVQQVILIPEDLSSNPMIFLKDAETDKLRFHTVCTEPCFLVCRCCKAATERGNNQLKTTSSSSTATKCSFISPTCSRSLLFTDLIGTRVA